MKVRTEIWTYLVVTIVTLLIWFRAADEERETSDMTAVIQFVSSDPVNRVVFPSMYSVEITLEGSRSALNRAKLLRSTLTIELASDAESIMLDMKDRLADLRVLADTGVRVVSTNPATVEIEVDQLVHDEVRVIPILRSVETVGEVTVEPETVKIVLPQRLRPSQLTAEAEADPDELARLKPDLLHTIELSVRIPGLHNVPADAIRPARVKVTFTVRSRLRSYTLDVKVDVLSPPEDVEYIVEIADEDHILHDVTIEADVDLIARIESGEVKVVAVLQLSSLDKEQRITEKSIACFMTIEPNLGRGQILNARIGNSDQPPVIHFIVKDR